MVSIRYFCGVGEFCSVKSKPGDGCTSKMGAARVVAHNPRAKTQHTRNKLLLNSDFLQAHSISRGRYSVHPPARCFHPWGRQHFCSTGETRDEFYASRRVDSRSTSLGRISIFCGLIGDFNPILAIRSSAASIPIWQVPWSMVVSGTDNTSE
jgi:hypothetical protein